jgi:hypothetical protein
MLGCQHQDLRVYAIGDRYLIPGLKKAATHFDREL